MNVSLIIALIIIVLIILYMVGNFFLNRRAVTELDQNEFHKGLRKAQVIDVREKLIMIMVILMVLAIFQYLCLDKDFKVYVKINLYIFVMQMVLPVIVCSHFEKMDIKIYTCLKAAIKMDW